MQGSIKPMYEVVIMPSCHYLLGRNIGLLIRVQEETFTILRIGEESANGSEEGVLFARVAYGLCGGKYIYIVSPCTLH